MSLRMVQFTAILLTALTLVPAGAHLLSLPNKMALSQQAYFTAQLAYRGWALLGVLLIGAIMADAWLAFLLRAERPAFLFAVVATLCLALSVVIFFIWVFPGNQATANWTVAPADWQTLRARWEYGHAASFILAFVALCGVIWSILSHDPDGRTLGA